MKKMLAVRREDGLFYRSGLLPTEAQWGPLEDATLWTVDEWSLGTGILDTSEEAGVQPGETLVEVWVQEYRSLGKALSESFESDSTPPDNMALDELDATKAERDFLRDSLHEARGALMKFKNVIFDDLTRAAKSQGVDPAKAMSDLLNSTCACCKDKREFLRYIESVS